MTPGSRLGPYEILDAIGAGGMGEVYRARDTKLNRDVAIKVLPPAFAQDTERMARFQREAQTLAALNHPNIAQVYGMESGALVMEYIPGQDLRGPLPLDEAMKIARQIGDALEAAHERGIVHRDLKPANVKVTPDGKVKVLDFGLAKAAIDESSDLANSPTLSFAATRAGVILGTASYMSPEQAKGKPVDARTDIWAYGCVLYELLTGKQAFPGETAMDAMAAIISREPDWSLLPPGSPVELLRACLQKDVSRRLRHIGDSTLVANSSMIQQTAMLPAAVEPARRSLTPWIASGVLAIALIVLASLYWRVTRPAPLRPLMRLSVEVGSDAPLAMGGRNASTLALSPDGTRLAVVTRAADGKLRLGTRLLNQSTVTLLSNTDGASQPFFSPDGQWIGFHVDGKLKKISVDGGAAVTLCEVPQLRGASWGDDGNIVLNGSAADSGLLRVSSEGGKVETLTTVKQGEHTHRYPQVLPGSKAVLFTASTSTNYDEATIEVFTFKTGERKIVQRGGFLGQYLDSGHLVYVHQSTLFVAPFDLNRLELTGPAVPVLEDVAGGGATGGGNFAFSRTGSFAYVPGAGRRGGWPLFWLDSAGKRQVLHAPINRYFTPRLSPDGKRLAFALQSGPQQEDIWVKDLERDTPSRLTFLGGGNRFPVWTPDGKGIVFRSADPKSPGIYWIRSDGSGQPQRLTETQSQEAPYSISPDGKRLAFIRSSGANPPDIWTAPIEGDPANPRLGKAELFLGTSFVESSPAFSPDGRWLAYSSSESGTPEVYVRPFPGPGGKWQISTGGGTFPLWSRSGRELLFERLGGNGIMVVSYTIKGEAFSAGTPKVWSTVNLVPTTVYPNYDLAPDGKRIAAFLPEEDAEGPKPRTHVNLLLNFFDELRRKAPGKN